MLSHRNESEDVRPVGNVKRSFGFLPLIAALLYPVCAGTGWLTGWEYSLRSETAYALVVCALSLAAVFVRGTNRACRLMLPAVCLCGVMLHVGLESRWVSVMTIISVAAGCAVFVRAEKSGWVRALAVLVFVPAAVLMSLFGLLMGGAQTVEAEYPSPQGTLTAHVRIADTGATGGDTLIRVYEADRRIPLLLGEFRKKTYERYADWLEEPDFLWLDEERFLWGGEEYTVQ